MKFTLLLSLIAFAPCIYSQADSAKYAQKVASIDAIVSTLYDVISGDAGEARDWDLFRYLYKDGAQMIPTQTSKEGVHRVDYITPQGYIDKSGNWLDKNGFHETEIARQVQQFGNIAHVFSTYECFLSKTDEQPFMRGINSIQLVYDQDRWWVVNIFWAQESKEVPIPKAFLPTP